MPSRRVATTTAPSIPGGDEEGSATPASQPLTGLGKFAADAGGHRVRRAFGVIPRTLLVERALLIQQPPSRPPERRGDHNGREGERPEQ